MGLPNYQISQMLAEASGQLFKRYSALAAQRQSLGSPVYAIEHDLTPDHIANLRLAASQKLRSDGLKAADWLVWIALSVEAGYAYAGDEYWPQLEYRPKEWRNNNSRDTLREWHKHFQRKFNGPIPVGRWAEHFNIIAWPVVNAVLPIYLQNLFARHLYDFRVEVAEVAAREPNAVGGLLYRRYTGNSSRLEDFLEQEELTTQIVLAVRDQDQAASEQRICGSALSRIVEDLSRGRDAKGYLAEARNVMRAGRVRFSGQNRASASPQGTDRATVDAEPRLVGQLTDTGVHLGVGLPQFAQVLGSRGISPDALKAGRVRFAGINERWSPASALLTWTGQERALSAFPSAGKALFDLSGLSEQVEEALRPTAAIVERPLWLLRRQMDGLFREQTAAQIRAKQDYLFVCRVPLPGSLIADGDLESLELAGGGACVYFFDGDLGLDANRRAALAELRIDVAHTAIVDPVGLAPRVGEAGRPTWLSTEDVTFRCSADFSVDSYLIALDGSTPASLRSQEHELVLSLGRLPVGKHLLNVAAIVRQTELYAKRIKPAQYEFDVVAPEPWQSALKRNAGFKIVTAPGLRLDDILLAQANIEVLGPIGRRVAWSIDTFDASGHLARSSAQVNLPVSATSVQVSSSLAKLAEAEAGPIEGAHRVDIVASIEELGRQSLSFPHVVQPLRWVFDERTSLIRLIDETSHDLPVKVFLYPLSRPLEGQRGDLSAALDGIVVEAPGGLFAARRGKRVYTLFATARHHGPMNSLTGLQITQSLSSGPDTAKSLVRLVQGLRRWQRARCSGPLSFVRKAMTVERIKREMADKCTGTDFAQVLGRQSEEGLTVAQQMIGGSPGFGHRMRTIEWSNDARTAGAQLARYAKLYHIEPNEQRCFDAALLAFQPSLLRLGAIDVERPRLEGLLGNLSLLRGAFLAKASFDLASAGRRTA
jgi:hypothetical protein